MIGIWMCNDYVIKMDLPSERGVQVMYKLFPRLNISAVDTRQLVGERHAVANNY